MLHRELPHHCADELDRLSREYARTRDPELRESLILGHQRLVRSIASKFIGSGECLDDIVQVGNVGLILAIDRFKDERGARFSTFATPTIMGEIRRYFRDKAVGIRVPRRLQEIRNSAFRARQRLVQTLGRQPSTAELADHLAVTEDHLLMALEAAEAMQLVSLDSGLGTGNDEFAIGERIGARDQTLSDVDQYSDLRAAMDRLPERERTVVRMRFFEDMSQAAIAEQLGISQMHVSRLQHRALQRMQETLSRDQRLLRETLCLPQPTG